MRRTMSRSRRPSRPSTPPWARPRSSFTTRRASASRSSASSRPTSCSTTSGSTAWGYTLPQFGPYPTWLDWLPRREEKKKISRRHPSFLLSGIGINYNPLPPKFSLSMRKAAQSNLLKTLEQMFGPQGVHVRAGTSTGPSGRTMS